MIERRSASTMRKHPLVACGEAWKKDTLLVPAARCALKGALVALLLSAAVLSA